MCLSCSMRPEQDKIFATHKNVSIHADLKYGMVLPVCIRSIGLKRQRTQIRSDHTKPLITSLEQSGLLLLRGFFTRLLLFLCFLASTTNLVIVLTICNL